MALDAIMDRTAVRAATLTGMKGAWSAASSAEGATVIPRSVDDWPVGIVWFDGSVMEPGNHETVVHDLELLIWVNATDISYAYKTIIPFFDRCRVLFRTDLDANTNAVRLVMTGARAVEVDEAHGKPFLVLPIQLEALEMHLSDDYAV
jgi:hypothetical protein